MGKLSRVAGKLASDELIGENLPKQPIIEVFGDNRVYIERHSGIYEYSDVQIHIGVTFGKVIISGGCLKLASMSKESVVIIGQIARIEICRG